MTEQNNVNTNTTTDATPRTFDEILALINENKEQDEANGKAEAEKAFDQICPELVRYLTKEVRMGYPDKFTVLYDGLHVKVHRYSDGTVSKGVDKEVIKKDILDNQAKAYKEAFHQAFCQLLSKLVGEKVTPLLVTNFMLQAKEPSEAPVEIDISENPFEG